MLTSTNKTAKFLAAIIICIPMGINLVFFQLYNATNLKLKIGAIITICFVLSIQFLIVYTGNVYKYRRVFFIVVAMCFFPSFIGHLIETRGEMAVSEVEVAKLEVPICHLVTPLVMIPYALTKTIIYPARIFNHYASVYSLLLIWLLTTVTMGRGWCSWVCFYGGWDEAASSIGKKKKIKINPKSPFARYFNFTMLLFLVLVSLKSLSVVYCEWFCPFKLITEHMDGSTFIGYLQFIFMVVIFIATLLVLPYLTKTRFQCGTFCPFGAFQSFFSKISPFKIVIDRNKCTDCLVCSNNCPTLSLTPESIKSGKAHITCTLCGKCIKKCPSSAIGFRFRWLPKLDKIFYVDNGKFILLKEIGNIILSPMTFLAFVGLTIGSIVSGGFMKDTFARLIDFVGGLF